MGGFFNISDIVFDHILTLGLALRALKIDQDWPQKNPFYQVFRKEGGEEGWGQRGRNKKILVRESNLRLCVSCLNYLVMLC